MSRRYDPTGDLDARLAVLEASAGTGKTRSIADLFLRLVAEPEWTAGPDGEGVRPDQILVVTYTEAATAEMRDRVRARLAAALEAIDRALAQPGWRPTNDPVLDHLVGGVNSEVLAQRRLRIWHALVSFDEVTISTIHGFCQRMLARNAFESGTDFDCELVPDLDDLVEEAVADAWVGRVHGLDPDRLALLEAAGGFGHFARLARAAVGDPDLLLLPELDAPVDEATFAEGKRAWEEAVNSFRDAWRVGSEALVDTIVTAVGRKALPGNSWRPDWVRKRAKAVGDWLAAGTVPDPAAKAATETLPRWFGRVALAGAARTNIDLPPLCDHADQCAGAAAAARDLAHRWLMTVRVEVAARVRDAVDRRKRERFVQGFDDLLRRLRDGLLCTGGRGDALAEAIASQYRVAIIDEFQDTDPVQWGIFDRVFRQGTGRLVLIGDPKQAIYGFRRADIDTYLRARDATGNVQRLGRNWRSDGGLVDAVNRLFGGVANPFLRDRIPYEDVDVPDEHRPPRWTPGAGATRAPLRIAFLPREPGARAPANKGTARPEVARRVAWDILAFLTSGATIAREGGSRPVAPGDVAVIVRTHREGRAIEAALRRAGVPSVRHGQESVLATTEAEDLLRLMDAILAPRDRAAVRTALATPLLGVPATRIAAIEADDDLADTWRADLERWAAYWHEGGFMRMLRAVLDERAVVERWLGWEGGERRLTNLLHLAELVHGASMSQGLRPQALAAWYRRELRAGNRDSEERLLRLESDADAVQVVTIHGCKGLEYPFVWCPFLWDGGGGTRDPFPRFHVGEKVAIDVAPEGPDRDRHVALAEAETLAESIRLAYVALTRARHTCTVITGAIKGFERSALSMLLHSPRAQSDGATPEERVAALAARLEKVTDETLEADLERLAASSGGNIEQVRLEGPPPVLPAFMPAATLRPEDLRSAQWDRELDLDVGWRWSSFSSLVRGHAESSPEGFNEARRDRDGGTPPPDAGAAGSPGAEVVPLDDFPRGVVPGELVHSVFEHLDFSAADRGAIATVVEREAAFHRLSPFADVLVDGVERAIATPLGQPGSPEAEIRLADLTPGDTLRELDFDFPVGGGLDAGPEGGLVTPLSLAEVFRSHPGGAVPADYADRLAALPFEAFRGFLTGAIDLVFRARGAGNGARWYVADYKSNRLPAGSIRPGTYGDYAPDRLLAAMVEHHYVLQYHLYMVALHRYLAWRLRGSYDPVEHLGGAFYLFVRGMRGAGGGDTGIFFDRPPAARILALSALFERPPARGGVR